MKASEVNKIIRQQSTVLHTSSNMMKASEVNKIIQQKSMEQKEIAEEKMLQQKAVESVDLTGDGKFDARDLVRAKKIQQSEAMKTADLTGLKQELYRLESKYSQYTALKKERDDYYNSLVNKGGRGLVSGSLAENAAKKDKKYLEYGERLAAFGDIETELTEKKNYYNNAKRIQEGIRLASVADTNSENYDSEFKKYSQKGEALANASSLAEWTKNVIAKWRNNPKQLESWEKSKNWFNGAMGESVLNNQLNYLAAKYMTDTEFSIYNYYLAKENDGLVEKGTAEKYLKAIQEDLTNRQGTDIADSRESTLSKYTYGYKAGIDQFTQGVINRLNSEDDYIPTTGTQKASAQIREEIKNKHGIVGQIGYDMINTTSNMLPSILTSAAAEIIVPGSGAVVGAGLMGLSASGGAYQEMLNLGYDKKQANAYSILVGTSEAALGYAFSGISKLGGAVTDDIIKTAISGIDNGIARFAIEFGGKIASEGLEEAAQEVLTPLFENIALGYDKNSFKDIDWAEVAYSGLLGMLSSTGFSAVETINDMRDYKKDTSFAKQVDDVINGTHNPRLDLYVSETPKVFTNIGFSDSALLMRNGKVKEILEKHPEMSVENIKKIPQALQNPILILKSKTKPADSVVAITDISTEKGNMVVPVWVNQSGNYIDIALGEEVNTETNFVASAYGRNVKALIEYANQNDGFLYQNDDIEKVRQLLARNGLQLPTPLKLSDSNINISQNDNDVNNIISQNNAEYSTKNKETVTQTHDADIKSPRTTPENASASPVSNINISQDDNDVNNIISTGEGNDAHNSLKSGERHHTTKAEQDYIRKICKALGRTVVFEHINPAELKQKHKVDTKGEIPDGYITDDGVIHLGFTVVDPINFVFKHELTHFGEGTEQYEKFVNAVRKSKVFKEWLAERTGLSLKDNTLEALIAAARQDIMDNRGGDASVDVEGAMAELIADFVGDCLFKDNGSGLEALVNSINVKDRPAFFQYIRDFLAYLKKKLAGDKDIVFEISHLEDSFNRMLSEASQAKSPPKDNSADGIKFSFARVHNKDLIRKAEEMERQGKNDLEIWHKLFIARDPGNVWVYEIDDSKMKFFPNGDNNDVRNDPDYKEFLGLVKKKHWTNAEAERYAVLDGKFMKKYDYGRPILKNYIKHDKLFEKYPQLEQIIVEFRDLTNENYRAAYSPTENKIILDSTALESGDYASLKKSLVHEIQHAIQKIDDREPGASIEYWQGRLIRDGRLPIDPLTKQQHTPHSAYLSTKGEFEAAESQERMEYTEDERRKYLPFFGKEFTISSRELVGAKNKSDAEYMKAVKSGDTEIIQSMVDSTAESAGYTERLYHQTGADFTEFNTDNQNAGKYDWELPTGTFLKPSDSDIGLKGKKQMELYAKLQNPLEFKDRQAAQVFWKKNIEGYSEAVSAIKKVDDEYTQKYSDAEGDVRRYMLSWKHSNPEASRRDIYSDAEFIRLHEKEQQILEEWESASNEASITAKELINDYIARNDYDGIVIEKDQDGENVSTKSYIVFNSSQLKDAAAVTYDNNGEVIPLSQRFNSEQGDIRFSMPRNARRITENMTESERYELLKDRKLSLAQAKESVYGAVVNNYPEILDKKLKETDAKKILYKIGTEFGVFEQYINTDVEMTFEFGKNNLSESVHKQKGNYDIFSQMLSCFSDVISNAVGIEVHNRNKDGYKTDRTLKNVYVLCSAFDNGIDIVPVKLEIKEFFDKPNRLYVAVALESIKKDRVVSMGVPNNRSHIRTSPVTISIRDLFSKINPKDKDFIKYIPEGFLTEEQIGGKRDTAHRVNDVGRPVGNALKNGISNNSISNDNDKVNLKFSIPQSTKTLLDKYDNGEISREKMEEQLDELWGAANEKYGSIEEGENAQTPLAVPKQVSDNKFTERFVRTFIETGKLTPEMIEDVEREILLGDTYSYMPVSDETAQKKADRYFEKGMAEDTWNEAVNTRAVNKYDIAVGEKLLLRAIESNDRLRVIELSSELADALTRAGQTVQAARMLKKMSGIGRLVTRQREVKTINKSLEDKYGDKAPTVKINPLLAKQLAQAKTQKGIDMVDDEIMQDIANQVPPTFLDKWNAWRYWAMLSNPKTHIRNLVGNAIFTPAVRIKDVLATGMEAAFVKGENRTKSLIIQREYAEFAKEDGKKEEVKQLLKGNKYNDKTALKEKQRIFKNNVMEFLTRFNSNALDAEDMLFKNKHYIHALAGYLQARKVNLSSVSEEVLTEARIYAVNEAIKATFNDESALANWIQNFGNKNILTNILVEGVLPFKRTPINIVKRGIEYSPLGLIKTLAKGVYDVKKGKFTPTEFIDGLASGLTGTGIMVVGMILANLGCVSGGEDDDKLSDFEKWLGKQEYAIEFAGKSYTIDWAAPACIPFFIGVEIVNTLSNGEDFQLSQVSNAIWNSLEPITNLSMLSGMQGVIESARYAESSQTLAAIAGDAITSYAMQGIPSLAGALSRTIDPTQRSWYTDKNDKVFDSFSQSVINNVKSKVPGLSFTQIPKIDPWGREVSRGKLGERIAENFISPGYYSELDYNETNDELKRLFIKTGESVFPQTAPKSFQVKGETKQLTADEYVTYAKARGEYSFEYINELINTSKYQKLTDEEKAEVITNLYSFANAKAKAEVSDYDLLGEGSKYKTVTRWERNGKSAADYYISNAISK